MNPALSISKTGIQAQDARLTTIAHNMANANTIGFKRDRAVFQDLSYQVEQQPAASADDNNPVPAGIQLGTGTRLVGTQKIFTEGEPVHTGQPLDIAIQGQGFLQVQTDNGEVAYTRDGQLRLNSEGQLTTMQGLLVLPEISIPPGATSINISETGIVSVTLPDSIAADEIGQLSLANFINPGGLLAQGGNLFKETPASGMPVLGSPGEDALGKIKSGMLEGSNVKAFEEMVALLETQRIYEMQTKLLSAADNMMQNLAQSVR